MAENEARTIEDGHGWALVTALLLLTTVPLTGLADPAPTEALAETSTPFISQALRETLGHGVSLLVKGVLALAGVPWLIAGLAFLAVYLPKRGRARL
ncbi:MAG: hypothetical protein ACE5JI_21240 [Acidobacteriota bacterium]